MKVYVATIPTKYEVVGVAETADAAFEAACREYRRTCNSGYGFPVMDGRSVRTDTQIEEWFGRKVLGPIPVPGAVTE